METCGECAKEEDRHDDNKSVCSRMSRRSTASGRSRGDRSVSSRRSMRSVSSRRSTRSASRNSRSSPRDDRRRKEEDEGSDSEASPPRSPERRHPKAVAKAATVKKMPYTDDNGDEGLYTGYVNSMSKPHGSGKIAYKDGRVFTGEWSEGSKVHGKTTNDKSTSRKASDGGKGSSRTGRERKSGGNGSVASSSVGGNSKSMAPTFDKEWEANKQQALKDYKELFKTHAHVVKNMIFVDFYGDKGRYTGEVNEKKQPHGTGEITYDHGLVQEGKWVSIVCAEMIYLMFVITMCMLTLPLFGMTIRRMGFLTRDL